MPKHHWKNASSHSEERHRQRINRSSRQQQPKKNGDVIDDRFDSPQKHDSSSKTSQDTKISSNLTTRSQMLISESKSKPHHWKKSQTSIGLQETTKIPSNVSPSNKMSKKKHDQNSKTRRRQTIETNKNSRTSHTSKKISGNVKKKKNNSVGEHGGGSSKRMVKSGSFYRGNFRYSTSASKGTSKITRSGQDKSTKRHATHNNIVDKATKVKLIKENAKKREKRIVETLNRRKNIDRDRVRSRRLNSGIMRQERLKKMAQEQRIRSTMISKWIMAITLSSRIEAAVELVQKFRQYKKQIETEDRAARIIARQMRLLKFKLYRRRVRGAIRVLASVFLVKVRLWKNSRRRMASDRVKGFLLALEKENKESGGCLALIVKGKKWRAYRMKIIVLQRLWRQRLRIISAQVLLIDRQWQREQHRRTEIDVEKVYTEEEAKAAAENDHIENINRTRKLIKLKPLPRKRCDTRDEIRERLKRGVDLLSVGNIVPSEIRYGLIRDMLKHLRCFHLHQLKLFNKALQKYEEEVKDRQRRRALLVKFSGNGIGSWVSRSNMIQVDQNNDISPPSKPFFHVVLGEAALCTLISLGQKYVEDLRMKWNPEFMKTITLPYFGREAAEMHFKENPYIAATVRRNQSFL